MNYTKKVITGFSWESVLKLSLYSLTLIKTFFLARILEPTDFGIFSLVIIALGISEAMTQTGINLTIIQSKHSVEYFLNTAWVISIARGFFIGILMILLGLGMNHFFQEPSLLPFVALSALVPVIKGFINPYQIVFHKKMLYFQDVLYRFSIQAFLVIGTLMLAIWLKTALALVLGIILAAVFEVGISHFIFKKRPIFEYIPSRAKVIFDNARWLSINSLLHYLVEHIDDFLIGIMTNTHALGIYHNSYGITHKASYEISKSVHYGTIPVYAQLSSEKTRLKKAFIKTFVTTLIIILLIVTPLYLFNNLLVNLLLGEKWNQAIPLIRPLIIAGSIQSIFMLCYTLMLASKEYKSLNIHLFISLISMGLFIYFFGKQSGLIGAVNGIVYSRIVSLPVILFFTYHYFSKSIDGKTNSEKD